MGIGYQLRKYRAQQAALPFVPDAPRLRELRSKRLLCVICRTRWRQQGDRCCTCKDLEAPVIPVRRQTRKPSPVVAHPVRYQIHLDPPGSIALGLVHRSRVIAPLSYLGS